MAQTFRGLEDGRRVPVVDCATVVCRGGHWFGSVEVDTGAEWWSLYKSACDVPRPKSRGGGVHFFRLWIKPCMPSETDYRLKLREFRIFFRRKIYSNPKQKEN